MQWATTIAFYCAVHCIEAHFARFGVHSSTHTQRESTMAQPMYNIPPDVYVAYKQLKQWSIQGRYRMRQEHGARPFASNDPDSQRIWWNEIGVHQNLTFPVQPDPVSGMHCWHQRVTLEKASPDDRYGDIFVDTAKSHEVYKEWLAMTRPAPGPGGLRRPLWFDRPLRPTADTYKL